MRQLGASAGASGGGAAPAPADAGEAQLASEREAARRVEEIIEAATHAKDRSTSSGEGDSGVRSASTRRGDIANAHLQVEGVIGGGGHSTVYWGTWRGLEVAIKTVVFEVRARLSQADAAPTEAACKTLSVSRGTT